MAVLMEVGDEVLLAVGEMVYVDVRVLLLVGEAVCV